MKIIDSVLLIRVFDEIRVGMLPRLGVHVKTQPSAYFGVWLEQVIVWAATLARGPSVNVSNIILALRAV